MKTETKNRSERLQFFRDLYENALHASADAHAAFDRSMAQYRGDLAIDGSDERAITVRNITYEVVESQVSSDIPMPKADPASYSERRTRNAESIERLLRSVRDRLPFEEMNDMDERYTYIYGGSVWYAEWDNSINLGGEVGGVRISCLSPKDLIPQPGIYSVEDMDYCFLRLSTTRAELIRRYGVSEEDATLAECEYEFAGDGDGDTVTVVVCFFRDEDGQVGRYVFSGNLPLSDQPKYYKRKILVCTECGLPDGECICGCEEREEREIPNEALSQDILLRFGGMIPAASPKMEGGVPVTSHGRAVMKNTEIPYYTPTYFPIVIRKNTSAERVLFGQSDCDFVRPEQQAINKLESRILQKLLRAGITPIVPEDATVTLNNSVFGQLIKMKPGESASQYGKVDTTPDISQDIIEAERLYDHAKRIIGISDAYQGIDGASDESGVAKRLRIAQATGRLESKKKMKHTAYASLDRIIFSLYLAFADEPRQLSYKDSFGRIQRSEFNRYDFIEYDIRTGEYYYDDDYLFSVDLNGGNGYQREALWERNLENLRAGTLGNPESAVTLLRYWQCQERAHYPYARENVEYFVRAVDEERKGAYYEQGEDLRGLS